MAFATITGLVCLDSEPYNAEGVTHADGAPVRYVDLYDREGGGVFRGTLAQTVDSKDVPDVGVPVVIEGEVRNGPTPNLCKLRITALKPAAKDRANGSGSPVAVAA